MDAFFLYINRFKKNELWWARLGQKFLRSEARLHFSFKNSAIWYTTLTISKLLTYYTYACNAHMPLFKFFRKNHVTYFQSVREWKKERHFSDTTALITFLLCGERVSCILENVRKSSAAPCFNIFFRALLQKKKDRKGGFIYYGFHSFIRSFICLFLSSVFDKFSGLPANNCLGNRGPLCPNSRRCHFRLQGWTEKDRLMPLIGRLRSPKLPLKIETLLKQIFRWSR